MAGAGGASTGGASTGGASTGGMSTGGSGGGFMLLPYCHDKCTTNADCAMPGASAILDADNYTCDAGLCDYQGCNTTQECVDTFKMDSYVCAAGPQLATKYCHPTCKTNADCAPAGASAITDADNYTCDAGVCNYKGCNSTQECTDANKSPDYVCGPGPQARLPYCHHTCKTSADCAVMNAPATVDADNYTCDAGVCNYHGCNSTQECTDANKSPDYVCK